MGSWQVARAGHLGAGNEWTEQEVPVNTVGDVQNSQLNSGDEVALAYSAYPGLAE